jgi:hypothetical protein
MTTYLFCSQGILFGGGGGGSPGGWGGKIVIMTADTKTRYGYKWVVRIVKIA